LRIAAWDETQWQALHHGADHLVLDIAAIDYGSNGGPALYAGGRFTEIGGQALKHVGKWDGSAWTALGAGLDGDVISLIAVDELSGDEPVLYAGGDFESSGGNLPFLSYIAKWNGASWLPVGPGLGGAPHCFAEFDDGTGGGPALYAGGGFVTAGFLLVSNIAKWDGREWSALANGTHDAVFALAVFDDGSGDGPALYAGGRFTQASGTLANRVAKWNGIEWSAVGTGTNGDVRALAVFDDGSGGGPALFAGGRFTIAGGVPANGIAKWDGSVWTALGTGLAGGDFNEILALDVFDDGSGRGAALYGGGDFTIAGGVVVNGIARWDGAEWSALGDGVENSIIVNAVVAFDDGAGGGSSLYIGGEFSVSPTGDSYLARWGGCNDAVCPGDIAPQPRGDGHVTISDITFVITAFGLPCDNCPQDFVPQPDGDNQVTIADITAVLTAFGPCP
jgi:hypothetical protein